MPDIVLGPADIFMNKSVEMIFSHRVNKLAEKLDNEHEIICHVIVRTTKKRPREHIHRVL